MAQEQGGIVARRAFDDDEDTGSRSDAPGAAWRAITPAFIAVFAYIVSYGVLLMFGLIAMAVLALAFGSVPATLVVPGDGPTSAALLDTLSGTVRLGAFFMGLLALWPAGLVGYLTWERLREDW